jgi:hypothetical protein
MGPLLSAIGSGCPFVLIGVMLLGIASYVLAVRCVGGSVIKRRMSKSVNMMRSGDGIGPSSATLATTIEDAPSSCTNNRALRMSTAPRFIVVPQELQPKSADGISGERGHETIRAVYRRVTRQGTQVAVIESEEQRKAEQPRSLHRSVGSGLHSPASTS